MAKGKHTSVYFNRETFKFVGLTQEQVKRFKEAYKSIDVDSELRKMALWLASPKGTRRTGNMQFILNWLSNASPSFSVPQKSTVDKQEVDLEPYLNDYLKGLWKGREHILELNKTKRKS